MLGFHSRCVCASHLSRGTILFQFGHCWSLQRGCRCLVLHAGRAVRDVDYGDEDGDAGLCRYENVLPTKRGCCVQDWIEAVIYACRYRFAQLVILSYTRSLHIFVEKGALSRERVFRYSFQRSSCA